MIHPTAIVHPRAKLDSTVRVGPYSVIDEHVTLGAHCVVGPHVHLTGHTTAGTDNHFHTGCVIGDAPQDLRYKGEPTGLRIGDHNVFREHVTVHRSNKSGEDTVVGSHNFLMAHSHVGHNAQLGDHIILANGVLLAGHVLVQDRVFMGGNAGVHQFVRVGTMALLQGMASISQDVPPFTIASVGLNILRGLNVVGMRRGGVSSADRLELRRLYHHLFRKGLPLQAAVEQARADFKSEPSRRLLDFIGSSRRGIITEKSGSGTDEGTAEG
jgi:UDP-N-acetylglucosamine acyltransferase